VPLWICASIANANNTAVVRMGQTQSAEILTLDTNIRDWVVLPMLLIMIFVNLVRERTSC